MDGLRRGLHRLFRSAGIGKVEVTAIVRFRRFAVEQVAQLLHGAAAVLLPFLHRPLLVGFRLVTDNPAVLLVRIGHLDVVAARSRLLLLAGGRSEYQPHRPDEYQHHSGKHYHFLTFQPLGFGQRLALLFRLPLVVGCSRAFGLALRLVLNLRFVLCLFHINKVLSDFPFFAVQAVPPVRHGLSSFLRYHRFRCHTWLCQMYRGQAPQKRRASPARCACVSLAASRPDNL